jgi:predicted RecB family nuclease
MESEFASWMDRFHLEYPGAVQPDEADASMEILQEKGNEHEEKYLKGLRTANADVCEIARGANAVSDTIAAMNEGRQVIYQGELRDGDFAGRSDFLRRVAGSSNLGDYHYEVWDTKLSRKAKPYFLVQLCCYAEILATIQGELPEYIGVILGDGKEKKFRTYDYIYFYRQLKKRFLDKESRFDREKRPIPDGMADHRRWTTLAKEKLAEMDHLSRVANIRRTQVRKLEKVDIVTLTGLANTAVSNIPKMESVTFNGLKSQAKLQLDSAGLERPRYELLPHTTGERQGLGLVPPQSALDVFFDMEGYPHIEGGLEYLFGASFYENGELSFCDWWAHDRAAEKVAFEKFVDWVYARWKKDPSMHIYHYASYEVSALRRLMGRHATRESAIDELLRSEVFVNLFTVVRQGLRVGTESYSIKYIEHLYREKRSTDVATAMDSVVFYQNWIEEHDGDDWNQSVILKQIRDYNKDDCDSTAQLAAWLRKEQSLANISWVAPILTESKSDAAEARDEVAQFAQDLLTNLPSEPEQARLQTLLAHLLEFHWREARPVFWAKFDRHQMTEQQLIEDANCLGGLTRTATPIQQVTKTSVAFEYKFDPSQDTKMDKDKNCFFAHDLSRETSIYSLDDQSGLVSIKLTPGQRALGDPPDSLSLIPNEYVPADTIAKSICRTVSSWKQSEKLPQAIEHFLLRKRPAIAGSPSGPIVAPEADLEQEAIKAVMRLGNSTLCIQGPPGSGKTTKGARIIVELIKTGKRVGVTSNSHKAITKLLEEVDKAAKEAKVGFRGTKIQSEKADFGLDGTSFTASADAKTAFGKNGPFDVVGGTAWAFSHELAVGQLDYLFVDEAGQVSIANLVGMAPSTKNIIVMGDQMQLSQPIQGSHPGESGQSILEYLLQDHQTIPADFGIFLGATYRMHPDVCHFISTAVYEGRLHADDKTLQRQIVLPASGGKYVKRASGILYVPVEHEGNAQGSDEEAEVIAAIIAELRGGKYVKRGQEFDILPKHILVVAPYNMQVRLLKTKHHPDRVGTVDKFQGQEAPIVIVSMCASDGNESPRGIEFLFSKNRLNVAISRAKCLAIVVGSPALVNTASSRVDHTALVNLYCRIVEDGTVAPSSVVTAKK